MSVDISEIKVGDMVMLGPFPVEEVSINDDNFSVILPYQSGDFWFDASYVVEHLPGPRKIVPWDRVMFMGSDELLGTVVFADVDFAWVRWEDDDLGCIVPVKKLTLVRALKDLDQ